MVSVEKCIEKARFNLNAKLQLKLPKKKFFVISGNFIQFGIEKINDKRNFYFNSI
jgi:hypothetical protein